MKQPSKPESSSRRASKVRLVPIAEMRVPTVGVVQRKFSKAQGEEYAAHLDLDKLGIPIVNWRDGIYWIVDGQHRIYALKANGFGTDKLECEVYENLTDPEMADIFLGRDDRRAINAFEKFKVACTAERQREAGIRRIVEANGLKISQAKEEDSVGAVTALGKVYDRAGDVVLGQVLRTIKHAYGGDATAFDRQVIEGLGLVFNRYNGTAKEKDMVERLGQTQHGVRGLLRRAESQRERTGNGKAQCVAAVVVEIYNSKTRRTGRLPAWWKSA